MGDVAALLVGLVLLTVAADRFVLGAARLSSALRVSPVVIGALVIGAGTSAPELVVTVLAAVQDSAELAVGNLVGSNAANVGLVLGSAALISTVAVGHATLRREVPLMLLAVGAFGVAAFDGTLSRLEGGVLLALGVAAIAAVVAFARADQRGAAVVPAARSEPLWRPALLALAGLVGTVAGAQLLVTGGSGLARALGVSEGVIGLTVVAVGTSLPELVTAVAAARRREADLVVGNVLGSNIFNSLPVAGVAGLLGTVGLEPALGLAVVGMVAICALAAVFLATGRRLARPEGAVLLVLFALVVGATLT
ncbi:MAG: calcium/sodium antiporter [Actinomycetota bacterium]